MTFRWSSLLLAVVLPPLRPPALNEFRRRIFPAESESQRQGEDDPGEDDEKTLPDNGAANIDLVQGDQHDKVMMADCATLPSRSASWMAMFLQ